MVYVVGRQPIDDLECGRMPLQNRLLNGTVTDLTFIETTTDLKRIAAMLKKETDVAVDLEADSMYHFQEKVCLLQMASEQMTVIIDPLAIDDMSALGDVFCDPSIRKIFHGADYDVRSLYRDFRFEINHLFDTQIACMFTGRRETGLDAVLQNVFDVGLDKKYQRKDWSQRPLPAEMIRYAANDVKYLLPLARILTAELRQKNRLAWVREECDLLSRVRPPSSDCQPLFLSFKGAGRLNPRQLCTLENLLQYRKQIAAKKDRPLFKIIGNRSILKLVRTAPVTPGQLAKSGALSQKQIAMYGSDLLDRIKAAKNVPAEQLPAYPRRKPPVAKPAAPNRVKKLKRWRDKLAKRLDIDAGLLMNKALLHTIASQNPISLKALERIEDMKEWQRKAFGKDIVGLLNPHQRTA